MRYLLFVAFTLFFSGLFGQTTLIKGEISGATGPVQILSYNNPFSRQIVLLTELEIGTNGTFSYSFSPKKQGIILFKIDEATTEILVNSGSELNLNFDLIHLSETDRLGISSKLVLTSGSSSDATENMLFSIERDLENLKESNRKKNGNLSSKYSDELSAKWSALLSPVDKGLKVRITNSLVFSNNIAYLKKFGKPNTYEALEIEFLNNFDYTFGGLRSLQTLFTNDLLFEFFTKRLGKTNYFTFVDQSLKSVNNEKLRPALELSLITIGLDRKWANPETAKQRLQQFIDENENPDLEKLALSIQGLYEVNLVGTEVQNFVFTNLNDERFSIDDFRGSYLLIDFWATWCGPCVKSMKKLPQLKTDFENNLNILCISRSDDPERVRKYVKKNGYGKELAFGISPDRELIGSYFNIQAIPLYFLVDPNGIIIDKAVNDPIEMVKRHLK